MDETPDDLRALQDLLDRSDAAAGAHLRDVITPERRLTAEEVCDRLQGMCLLVLATVTADGRPLASPVDAVFWRGAFYFGTSPQAVKIRHIRARPAVSATHLPGEPLSITVHGTAHEIDVTDPDLAGLRTRFVEVYGDGWEEWAADGAYARIDADRMFTFELTPEARAAIEAEQAAAAAEG